MSRNNRCLISQSTNFYEELVRAAHSRDYTLMWIGMLANPDTRALALKNLNSNLRYIDDIGRLLWLRPNALAALLTELRSGHEVINSLIMPTSDQMVRLYEVLRLIRCLTSEADFRLETLMEQIPILLIPYLSNKSSYFDVLRVLALNAIDSLVRPVAEREVVEHLIESSVLSICLSSLEMDGQISKNISVSSILYHVLMNVTGLELICQSYEMFSRIIFILKDLIVIKDSIEHTQLLKYIIGCFLCFSENTRTFEILRVILPDQLRTISSSSFLEERDDQIVTWLTQLKEKLELN